MGGVGSTQGGAGVGGVTHASTPWFEKDCRWATKTLFSSSFDFCSLLSLIADLESIVDDDHKGPSCCRCQ